MKKTSMLFVIAMLMVTLAALMLFIRPVTARAAENPLRIEVKQVFVTSLPSADNQFTYKLKPLNQGNPLPEGSASDGYPFLIAGNSSAHIGPIKYDRQGTYQYELSQVIGEVKPGYFYDVRVYTIEVHVNEALSASLIVLNANGTKSDQIVFENGYDSIPATPSPGVKPSDPKLMMDPPVKKTVSGHPSKDSTFTFKLVALDILQPMPAGSVNGVKTLTIKGSGQGEFGTWVYDKAGTYLFTVYEVNDGVEGYIYDSVVYMITDVVKEENGQLTVNRTVTNNKDAPVTSLTFVNKFTDEESVGDGGNPGGPGTDDDPGKPDGPGKPGPSTGDDTNTVLYHALFAVGGGLAAVAVIYLIVGRKHKKQKNN